MDSIEARQAQINEYYSKWVGVEAPELGQAARDRDDKPVTLSSFRGKRLLLFSFDAHRFQRRERSCRLFRWRSEALEHFAKREYLDGRGIDAIGGRPGLVIFSNGEKVFVVDSNGRDVGTISTESHDVFKVAAAEIDDAGERQVVSIWPANVGTADYAVATDLEGNVLWKYPVNLSELRIREISEEVAHQANALHARRVGRPGGRLYTPGVTKGRGLRHEISRGGR